MKRGKQDDAKDAPAGPENSIVADTSKRDSRLLARLGVLIVLLFPAGILSVTAGPLLGVLLLAAAGGVGATSRLGPSLSLRAWRRASAPLPDWLSAEGDATPGLVVSISRCPGCASIAGGDPEALIVVDAELARDLDRGERIALFGRLSAAVGSEAVALQRVSALADPLGALQRAYLPGAHIIGDIGWRIGGPWRRLVYAAFSPNELMRSRDADFAAQSPDQIAALASAYRRAHALSMATTGHSAGVRLVGGDAILLERAIRLEVLVGADTHRHRSGSGLISVSPVTGDDFELVDDLLVPEIFGADDNDEQLATPPPALWVAEIGQDPVLETAGGEDPEAVSETDPPVAPIGGSVEAISSEVVSGADASADGSPGARDWNLDALDDEVPEEGSDPEEEASSEETVDPAQADQPEDLAEEAAEGSDDPDPPADHDEVPAESLADELGEGDAERLVDDESDGGALATEEPRHDHQSGEYPATSRGSFLSRLLGRLRRSRDTSADDPVEQSAAILMDDVQVEDASDDDEPPAAPQEAVEPEDLFEGLEDEGVVDEPEIERNANEPEDALEVAPEDEDAAPSDPSPSVAPEDQEEADLISGEGGVLMDEEIQVVEASFRDADSEDEAFDHSSPDPAERDGLLSRLRRLFSRPARPSAETAPQDQPDQDHGEQLSEEVLPEEWPDIDPDDPLISHELPGDEGGEENRGISLAPDGAPAPEAPDEEPKVAEELTVVEPQTDLVSDDPPAQEQEDEEPEEAEREDEEEASPEQSSSPPPVILVSLPRLEEDVYAPPPPPDLGDLPADPIPFDGKVRPATEIQAEDIRRVPSWAKPDAPIVFDDDEPDVEAYRDPLGDLLRRRKKRQDSR